MAALRALIIVCFFMAGAIRTGMVGPNRHAVEQAYGLDHSRFGASIAVIQILAAGSVLAIADRLRRRNPVGVLVTGLGIQVVGFSLPFALHGLWALAVGWWLVTFGLSFAAIANNIAMDLWRRNPRRGVTLLHGYNAGGKVAGPLIAAACLHLSDWRQSFPVMGAITLLILLALIPTRRSAAAACAGHDAERQAPRSHAVFRSGWYWVICLSFGLIAGGEAAFASLLPVYLIEAKRLSQEAASLLLTLHLCGLVAGRFASAYLGDRLSNNAIIALCLAAGSFVFPALLVDAWPVRNAALFLLGLLFSSTWPTFYAQATAHLREHRAMLAYGSSLGNVVGISLCLLFSSLLADRSLLISLLFGPAVLWLFGACYFTTRLARGGTAA